MALGKWKIIATEKLAIKELPPLTRKELSNGKDQSGLALILEDNPIIIIGGNARQFGNQSIKGLARRVVAVLKDGSQRVLIPVGHGARGVEHFAIPARRGEESQSPNKILASDIKELCLQVQPVEWVEFRGVPLNYKP